MNKKNKEKNTMNTVLNYQTQSELDLDFTNEFQSVMEMIKGLNRTTYYRCDDEIVSPEYKVEGQIYYPERTSSVGLPRKKFLLSKHKEHNVGRYKYQFGTSQFVMYCEEDTGKPILAFHPTDRAWIPPNMIQELGLESGQLEKLLEQNVDEDRMEKAGVGDSRMAGYNKVYLFKV